MRTSAMAVLILRAAVALAVAGWGEATAPAVVAVEFEGRPAESVALDEAGFPDRRARVEIRLDPR